MNLNAYDDVIQKLDKTKTWYHINRQQLFSREIKHTPYYSIAEKYNNNDNSYDYFILMLFDKPTDRTYHRTNTDDYGRIKISVKSIVDKTSLKDITKDCNINIKFIDEDDTCIVYGLDI